ncbi:MAG TPA: phytanoyl-CoA dioxygenase family protein, partial [Polyangiaceae bacterium]
MLNQEQRATLWDEGFVVVDRVFQGEEMEELTQDLHAYDRRNRERLRRDRGGVEGISRADEIVFTSHIAEADPKVRAFCLRPELVSIATSVLGANIDLYWNQSVFKEPETRAE